MKINHNTSETQKHMKTPIFLGGKLMLEKTTTVFLYVFFLIIIKKTSLQLVLVQNLPTQRHPPT